MEFADRREMNACGRTGAHHDVRAPGWRRCRAASAASSAVSSTPRLSANRAAFGQQSDLSGEQGVVDQLDLLARAQGPTCRHRAAVRGQHRLHPLARSVGAADEQRDLSRRRCRAVHR